MAIMGAFTAVEGRQAFPSDDAVVEKLRRPLHPTRTQS
jgi:hypothetical protein